MSEKIKKAKEQMLKEYLSSQLIYVEYTSYIENKVKNILIVLRSKNVAIFRKE